MKAKLHELKNFKNKIMSKTTKIITLIAIVILAISCKKESQSNPNIIYTSINKTLTMGTSNLEFGVDINKDGINDLKFGAYTRYDGSVLSDFDATCLFSLNDSIEVIRKQLAIPWKSTSYSYFIACSLYSDYEVNNTAPSAYFWQNPIRPSACLSIKIRDQLSTDSTEFSAFTESPKSYIAVKIMKNNPYYGWICVSTSKDGKSMTIYDAAISKLPNTPIKTGEK
jgi:hypothetical protein